MHNYVLHLVTELISVTPEDGIYVSKHIAVCRPHTIIVVYTK
jgi:hypothetical protein